MDKAKLINELEQQVEYLVETQKKHRLVREEVEISKQIVEVIMAINSIRGSVTAY